MLSKDKSCSGISLSPSLGTRNHLIPVSLQPLWHVESYNHCCCQPAHLFSIYRLSLPLSLLNRSTLIAINTTLPPHHSPFSAYITFCFAYALCPVRRPVITSILRRMNFIFSNIINFHFRSHAQFDAHPFLKLKFVFSFSKTSISWFCLTEWLNYGHGLWKGNLRYHCIQLTPFKPLSWNWESPAFLRNCLGKPLSRNWFWKYQSSLHLVLWKLLKNWTVSACSLDSPLNYHNLAFSSFRHSANLQSLKSGHCKALSP